MSEAQNWIQLCFDSARQIFYFCCHYLHMFLLKDSSFKKKKASFSSLLVSFVLIAYFKFQTVYVSLTGRRLDWWSAQEERAGRKRLPTSDGFPCESQASAWWPHLAICIVVFLFEDIYRWSFSTENKQVSSVTSSVSLLVVGLIIFVLSGRRGHPGWCCPSRRPGPAFLVSSPPPPIAVFHPRCHHLSFPPLEPGCGYCTASASSAHDDLGHLSRHGGVGGDAGHFQLRGERAWGPEAEWLLVVLLLGTLHTDWANLEMINLELIINKR